MTPFLQKKTIRKEILVMHCVTEGRLYGSLSVKTNKISPNCKRLVAV